MQRGTEWSELGSYLELTDCLLPVVAQQVQDSHRLMRLWIFWVECESLIDCLLRSAQVVLAQGNIGGRDQIANGLFIGEFLQRLLGGANLLGGPGDFRQENQGIPIR